MTLIQLTKGFKAKVDDQDVEFLKPYSWCVMGPVNGGYYAVSRINYVLTQMSRFLVNAQKGDIVDHLNGDTLDNGRRNLRLVRKYSEPCNGANLRNAKLSKRNSSGFRGVRWDKKKKLFVVGVMINRQQYYIGSAHSAAEGAQMHRAFLEEKLKQDYEREIYPKYFSSLKPEAA